MNNTTFWKSLGATPPIRLLTPTYWLALDVLGRLFMLAPVGWDVLPRCHYTCTGFLPIRWEVTAYGPECTVTYPSKYTTIHHLSQTPTVSTHFWVWQVHTLPDTHIPAWFNSGFGIHSNRATYGYLHRIVWWNTMHACAQLFHRKSDAMQHPLYPSLPPLRSVSRSPSSS